MNGKIQTRPNFNFSVVSAAKHSLDSKIPRISSGVGLTNIAMTSAPVKPLLDLQHGTTGHADISTRRQTLTYDKINIQDQDSSDCGVYQTLASLALICILSLFMAFLALFFLQKIGPLTLTCGKPFSSESLKKLIIGSEEFLDVYQVSISLSTLTIAFNLCCLFVCSIQFLFAIKLMKTPQGDERTNKFLKRTSYTRIIAMGGFFVSIPIFFTGSSNNHQSSSRTRNHILWSSFCTECLLVAMGKNSGKQRESRK
ncbi:uncharacterized protein LOC143249736 isoform X2 [Tachypleus tridentatus]|uniref:uncharacterized protein LOC143249736 isoform X2 n=1 Tax=Tachypleus tridentatus TaxID=6853 RepID=UPI003FD2960A